MTNTTYITASALGNYVLYAGLSLLLLGIFTRLYKMWTPYNEFSQIKNGKKAPALSLGGAMLGFTVPILSLSLHSVNLLDFFIWSVVAGATQLALFKLLYWLMPMNVDEDNQAIGILYAFAAICVGLVNAFSLIPS